MVKWNHYKTINRKRRASHEYDSTRSKEKAISSKTCKQKREKSSRMYGVSLSSVKRWCKRYDGTWQSLMERSHRPKSHPKRHKPEEERVIREAFKAKFFRYGWDGVYDEAVKNGYIRNFSGMVYAARRLGLVGEVKEKEPPRKHDRRYSGLLTPGEKVQTDVKEVPYNCLKGAAKSDEKHLYQRTAIDECTGLRFVYGFEEHTPENSVKFLKMEQKAFPFKIQTIQTDNGTEFTYKYISDDTPCPFDTALKNAGITHKLIPPRTPWQNGKVERSHRNDQRYFYDWEKFSSVEELNNKLCKHLSWSNRKAMQTLGGKSPIQILKEKLTVV